MLVRGQAGIRGTTGRYDDTAFLAYEKCGRPPIVIINDLKGKTDGRAGTRSWPEHILSFLRHQTDGMSRRVVFGQDITYTVRAKIIVNSTWDPPEDAEIRRRYTCVQARMGWGLHMHEVRGD